jgi:hypothetical protein
MVVAEISIFPLGTGSISVSRYVAAAVSELESSGLKCTLGPMGDGRGRDQGRALCRALAGSRSHLRAWLRAGLHRDQAG